MEHPTTAMRTGFINSKTAALEEKTVESFMLLSYLLCRRFPIHCTALHLILERSHGLEVSKSNTIIHKIFPDTHYP
jgi:hypothetical protein